MGEFLRPHGACLAAAGVVEPGLLHHLAAAVIDRHLPLGLVLDRLHHEADGIDVLDLGARAQPILAHRPHRDIDVATHRALLHVAVAGAEIAHDGAQLPQVSAGLLRAADVRLGDDFHQRHAGPVEIDEGEAGMLVVDRLAGVLLDVQPFDADVLGAAVRQVDADDPLADQRPLVLRDSIAGGQVGVEVVLSLEHALQVDPGVQADAGAYRLLDANPVEYGQHAGKGGVDEAHL